MATDFRAVAFTAQSGAGKSTSAQMLAEIARDMGWSPSILRVASPLYDLQSLIYTYARRPLADSTQQDSQLLGALGTHLRRINAQFLVNVFEEKLVKLRENPGSNLVICDDARLPDWEFIRRLNFSTVQVAVDSETRLKRRDVRGDINLSDAGHPLESPIPGPFDFEITNGGSRDELRSQIRDMATTVLR